MGNMVNKLQDVCLCAIVKNEKINPAGGIVDYIDSVVPYVGAAVIIDTGSTDGTREILDKCSNKYSNLKIFDREFKGFSDARNYSIFEGKKSDRKYAFFLDADERLSGSDFEKLNHVTNKFGSGVYSFDFYHISFENGKRDYSPTWHNRLVSFVSNPIFKRKVYETLDTTAIQEFFTGIHIKHFLPSKDIRFQKLDWYKSMDPYGKFENDCLNHIYIRDFKERKKTNTCCGHFLDKGINGNCYPLSLIYEN